MKYIDITLAADTGEKFLLKTYNARDMRKWAEKGFLNEMNILSYARANVPPGGVFVDCGAFIGNHSLYFAKCCQAEKVYAFEPIAENRYLLWSNILENKLSSIIEVSDEAVSNIPGPGKECANERGMYCSVIEPGPGDVNITTVDSMDWDRVDFLKIDVESLSLMALIGSLETIKRCRPIVSMEVPNADGDAEKIALYRVVIAGFFKALGYERVFKAGRNTSVYRSVP